jgi:hypothetical protein
MSRGRGAAITSNLIVRQLNANSDSFPTYDTDSKALERANRICPSACKVLDSVRVMGGDMKVFFLPRLGSVDSNTGAVKIQLIASDGKLVDLDTTNLLSPYDEQIRHLLLHPVISEEPPKP